MCNYFVSSCIVLILFSVLLYPDIIYVVLVTFWESKLYIIKCIFKEGSSLLPYLLLPHLPISHHLTSPYFTALSSHLRLVHLYTPFPLFSCRQTVLLVSGLFYCIYFCVCEVCIYTCAHVWVCTCVWKPKVRVWCLCKLVSTLFFWD